MKVVNKFHLAAPVDEVVRVLLSETYNLDSESARQEVVSSRFAEVERTDDHVTFEVRSTEYKRKMTGALDRSGTVESVTRSRWDARARTLNWTYKGVGSEWVQVSGVYRLAPAGADATEVVHEATVESHVPLLGGKIAKYAAAEMDKSFKAFPDKVGRHLRR